MTASERLKAIEKLGPLTVNADEINWLLARVKKLTDGLEFACDVIHHEFCSAEHNPVCLKALKALEE